MIDYNSAEFQSLLSRYEQSVREGNVCYMDADDFVDISDYYLDQNLTQDSLQAVESGLEQHPDDDLLHSVKAGVLIYMHRFDEAQAIVDTLSPDDNYDIIYLRAQLAYAKERNIAKAEPLFREWLHRVEEEWGFTSDPHRPISTDDDDDDVNPDEAERELREAYVHIIMSYIELSDQDHTHLVRHWIEEYLQHFSDIGSIESDFIIADLCRDENQLDLVETIYSRLLEYDPYTPHAWTVLAAAQQVNGKFDESLNSLEFALAIDPDDVDAILTKAHSLYGKQNYAEALDCFLHHRDLTGSQAEDQYIAACYINVGKTEEAVTYLRLAGQYLLDDQEMDNESKAWALYELADGFLSCQLNEEALELAEQAAKTYPTRLEYVFMRGTALLAMDNLKEAVKCYSYVLSNSDDVPMAMANIGTRFMLYDYPDAAAMMFETALSQDVSPDEFPKRDHLYAYLAMAKYQTGKVDEAMDYLKTACEVAPVAVKNIFSDVLPDTVMPQDYYNYIVNSFFNSTSQNS